jgi:hypothetical protein
VILRAASIGLSVAVAVLVALGCGGSKSASTLASTATSASTTTSTAPAKFERIAACTKAEEALVAWYRAGEKLPSSSEVASGAAIGTFNGDYKLVLTAEQEVKAVAQRFPETAQAASGLVGGLEKIKQAYQGLMASGGVSGPAVLSELLTATDETGAGQKSFTAACTA